jgi:hypothetical protein
MGLSIMSLKSNRVTKKDVQKNNTLVQFTSPPIETGDLNVNRDLRVGRNTYLNKLNVNGDLDVSGNVNVQYNLLSYGTIFAKQYLPGQIVNVAMLSNVDLSQNNITYIDASNTVNIFYYNYTPKIANSYILIEYQTKYTVSGGADDSVEAYLNVYDISDHRISQTYQQWINSQGGGTRSGTIFPIVGRYTNSNTSSKTIRVDVYNHTDLDRVTVNGDISTWLKITEIGR